MRFLTLIAFMACIPAANWLIGNAGTVCIPDGPCLIPVGFGYMAPSGVLVVGAALVLRDMVQQSLGLKWAMGAILIGAALSGFVSPAEIAIASGLSFLVSEMADTAVYTPLRKRGFVLALIASSIVGSIVDSVVFLYVAFGSLEYLTGQVIGKTWAVLAVVAMFCAIRHSRRFNTQQRER